MPDRAAVCSCRRPSRNLLSWGFPARRFWPSGLRHVFCPGIISLDGMARPVARRGDPLAHLMRWRTVAKVLLFGSDVRMHFQCPVG
jgi:hypothetical protein